MLQKVRRAINTYGLLRPEGKVIVALSGGADSVALLDSLLQLGYDCVAAHCNFHLRGEESNRDMHHAEAITERLGVDLYVKDFDVAGRRKLSGESLEMACRTLRYEWFFELLDRDSAQAIAVGHHREDQVETFFLNLLRGSGLTGLAGMRHRSEHVVRPLLDVSRAEIESYLVARGLEWVTDSTNAADDFARNRLRNRLLPMMEQLFEGAGDAVLRSMAILRENHDFFARALADAAAPYVGADGSVNLAAMSAGCPQAGLVLFEHLKGEGFSRTQTDDMLRAAARSGGSFTARATHTRDVDHGILRPARASRKASEGAVEVSLLRDIFSPVNISVTRHSVAEFRPGRDPNVAYIDERALEGKAVWRLRPWSRGDRMTPYGMAGQKLLSDIFADARLSAEQKRGVWLLTRNDEILWAVGIRASAKWAVVPGTKRYLRLQFNPDSNNTPQ